MGFFDFLTGGNKKSSGSVSIEPLMPSWQSGLGEDLSNWVRKYLSYYSPGEPYTGKLSVKEPSAYEKKGLGELESLLAGPATGDLYGAAKGQVLDTLAGKFADPATSPFIQAATKMAGQNLQDAIRTARGQRGARGTFFTKAGIEEESRLSERTQNYLNTVIGDWLNAERGRQFAAAPVAQGLESYGMLEAPLKRITASQTLGALPRVLEQADLDRMYQDYTRQRSELKDIPSVGTSVFSKQIPYLTQTFAPQPTAAESVLPVLANLPWDDIFGGGGNSMTSGQGLPEMLNSILGGGSSGGSGKSFYKDPNFYMDIVKLLAMMGA